MKTIKKLLKLSDRNVLYLFGRGCTKSILNVFSQAKTSKKIIVIVDSTIKKLYARKIHPILSQGGYKLELIELLGGDSHKTLKTAEILYEKLIKLDTQRNTHIIAMGGGVITDLVGFVSSTYMRGVPLSLIPTTLLAQGDAAIGGKTGVNLKQGKNLIGSFYHPQFVFIDPDFLSTLPKKEFLNGLPELIKMSMLAGEKAFSDFEREAKTTRKKSTWIDRYLLRAIEGKMQVVKKDPLDHKERMWLNLGHTFAHAIETATEYTYTHGEAVSIGLVGACLLAERVLGTSPEQTRRVELLIQKFQLPIRYKGLSPKFLLNCMAHDKKKKESLRFILPLKMGKIIIRENIPETIILDVLDRLKEGFK